MLMSEPLHPNIEPLYAKIKGGDAMLSEGIPGVGEPNLIGFIDGDEVCHIYATHTTAHTLLCRDEGRSLV